MYNVVLDFHIFDDRYAYEDCESSEFFLHCFPIKSRRNAFILKLVRQPFSWCVGIYKFCPHLYASHLLLIIY